jgi:hypothetical protein
LTEARPSRAEGAANSTSGAISRAEIYALLACCAVLSLIAIVWSWRQGAMLNYGDAVAHLHIARRVFDSHRPGPTQLGSVWLPLPHIVLIPFVAVYAWWANGAAALIPSALSWLASCAGIYRLARRWLAPASAAIALAFFALNPNLLYLQTTAMTEPIFLCEMVWLALWLVEWRAELKESGLDESRLEESSPRRANRLLWLIAGVLVAAIYTRYDGWIMALLAWCAIGIVLLRRRQLRSRTFWLASVLVVAAPVAWFAYNAVVFGDWLDFLRGPYSAKAIELRTAAPGPWPPHPGWHNPWVSLVFYVKCAEMDSAALALGNALLVVSLLGAAWGWLTARGRAFSWALLLWLPLPFYTYSVAYGSVPIFLPVWWPHSWYNTRYGLELLPAFALGLGFAASFVLAAIREFKPRLVPIATAILFAALVLNAAQMLHEEPIVYIEGTKNIESRRSYVAEIPAALRESLASHPGGIVLMETSVLPQIVAFTGIPLRQTINESDKEFYRAALAAPAQHAALVLAFDGDEIDRAVRAHPEGLTPVRHFAAPYQPSATLYVSDTPPAAASPAAPAQ